MRLSMISTLNKQNIDLCQKVKAVKAVKALEGATPIFAIYYRVQNSLSLDSLN